MIKKIQLGLKRVYRFDSSHKCVCKFNFCMLKCKTVPRSVKTPTNYCFNNTTHNFTCKTESRTRETDKLFFWVFT